MWECPVCTLLNEDHRSSCDVCETPRPAPVLRLGANPPTSADGAAPAAPPASSKAATLALRTPPSERHERANGTGELHGSAAVGVATGTVPGAVAFSTARTAAATAEAAATSSSSAQQPSQNGPAVTSRAGLSIEERQKREAEIAAKRIRLKEQQELEHKRFEEDRNIYNELHNKASSAAGGASATASAAGRANPPAAASAVCTGPRRVAECTSVRLQVKSEMKGTTVNTTAFGPESNLKDVFDFASVELLRVANASLPFHANAHAQFREQTMRMIEEARKNNSPQITGMRQSFPPFTKWTFDDLASISLSAAGVVPSGCLVLCDRQIVEAGSGPSAGDGAASARHVGGAAGALPGRAAGDESDSDEDHEDADEDMAGINDDEDEQEDEESPSGAGYGEDFFGGGRFPFEAPPRGGVNFGAGGGRVQPTLGGGMWGGFGGSSSGSAAAKAKAKPPVVVNRTEEEQAEARRQQREAAMRRFQNTGGCNTNANQSQASGQMGGAPTSQGVSSTSASPSVAVMATGSAATAAASGSSSIPATSSVQPDPNRLPFNSATSSGSAPKTLTSKKREEERREILRRAEEERKEYECQKQEDKQRRAAAAATSTAGDGAVPGGRGTQAQQHVSDAERQARLGAIAARLNAVEQEDSQAVEPMEGVVEQENSSGAGITATAAAHGTAAASSGAAAPVPMEVDAGTTTTAQGGGRPPIGSSPTNRRTRIQLCYKTFKQNAEFDVEMTTLLEVLRYFAALDPVAFADALDAISSSSSCAFRLALAYPPRTAFTDWDSLLAAHADLRGPSSSLILRASEVPQEQVASVILGSPQVVEQHFPPLAPSVAGAPAAKSAAAKTAPAGPPKATYTGPGMSPEEREAKKKEMEERKRLKHLEQERILGESRAQQAFREARARVDVPFETKAPSGLDKARKGAGTEGAEAGVVGGRNGTRSPGDEAVLRDEVISVPSTPSNAGPGSLPLVQRNVLESSAGPVVGGASAASSSAAPATATLGVSYASLVRQGLPGAASSNSSRAVAAPAAAGAASSSSSTSAAGLGGNLLPGPGASRAMKKLRIKLPDGRLENSHEFDPSSGAGEVPLLAFLEAVFPAIASEAGQQAYSVIISSEIPRVTVSSDQLSRPLSSFPSLFPSGGTILILERDRATTELRAASGQEFYFRQAQARQRQRAAQVRRQSRHSRDGQGAAAAAAQSLPQHPRVRHRNRTNRNGRGMPGLEDEDDFDWANDMGDDDDSDEDDWDEDDSEDFDSDSDDDMDGGVGGGFLDPFSAGEVAAAYPPPMSRESSRYQERLNQLGIETFTAKIKPAAEAVVINLEDDDEQSTGGAGTAAAGAATSSTRHPKSDAVGPDGDASMGVAGEEEEQELCVICQCPFQEGDDLRRLPCMHRFHAECIARGLQYSSCCPVCKYDLTAGFSLQS